jgi:phosphatidylserine decarboxylase
VLTLGDSRQTTQYVPKTLNPEWNHICEMPVNGIDSLILDCVCWDKDRFGKDYLGEIELALEEIFANDSNAQPAKWYPLKDRRGGKKNHNVSGEVQMQFTLVDHSTPGASPQQVIEKFRAMVGEHADDLTPIKSTTSTLGPTFTLDTDDELDIDEEASPSDETEGDTSKPEAMERKRRRMRIKGLKKRKQSRVYNFTGESDMVGIIFLEIGKITDLPPEKNITRTSFDMDPFVVASLGKKTFRTRVIRHNLNPVFNEKMIFQVLRHEQGYSMAFTVIDRDKLSGNDFIASASIPIPDITDTAPEADPQTGLYKLREPPEIASTVKKSRFKIALSRSTSSSSLSKLSRPQLFHKHSREAGSTPGTPPNESSMPYLAPVTSNPSNLDGTTENGGEQQPVGEDADLHSFTIPLSLKNKEKWEEKHNPELTVRAKYLPYTALRQQFWRAMLKQYDSDESGRISKVELTTMLDTLGSTLKESTIDAFFERFPHRNNGDEDWELTMDEAVICLEDQLTNTRMKQSMGDRMVDKAKSMMPDSNTFRNINFMGGHTSEESNSSTQSQSTDDKPVNEGTNSTIEIQHVPSLGKSGEEGDLLDASDLQDDRNEEHVVEIKECPICHQPRLNRRSDVDIITHIATCASQDWRQVNNIVMAGFVTSSQAQRKWYSKVITKISYGGYALGANSANILVQDRVTGMINEERMSIYVRLGIRLLYKGLKSRDMEKKRIRKLLKGLSVKQGLKYDDPASRSEIAKFIAFHRLDMSEVRLPTESFRNFNEFFYRQLKVDARPCSAPHNPKIIVSPADCRSVVFNHIDEATRIWIKGREFSVARLLGNTYPEDVARYTNGALGIFRLAPQDYHRFHIPVDGVMATPKTIEGEYYTVNPMAIRSALDVYGENVRVVVPIDSQTHGRVMVVCVGAMMVGSTVITRQPGERVHRAEELGYFKFGGSTLILLFEQGMMKFDDDLVENSKGALETLVCLSSCCIFERRWN